VALPPRQGALTDFKRLLLSVRDFLAVTRALVIGKKRAEGACALPSRIASTRLTPFPLYLGLVYCEREKSLVEVMNRINETRVHRLYVVDEQRKPVGVVSLTDICHSLQRVFA
jgi:CBS domain-containing protein